MPTISVRISDRDAEALDRLVTSVRAYYEREAQKMPVLGQIETTRSSALRDLLSAWDHPTMDVRKAFSREIHS